MAIRKQPKNNANAVDWRALASSRLVIALGALLIAQVILALVLDLRGPDLSPAAAQGPLLSFDQSAVTRIRIESPGKDPLVLEKTAGGWRIPALGGFPAAELRVTDLLTKLAGVQKRLPVATSDAARKRFKVADDTFERRLTLASGEGPLATVYLGDSPGFRRLFVRADGDKAIYEAALALFEASNKPDDWSDKNALHLHEKDVQRIELPGIVLARGDKGAWKLADQGVTETLDTLAVNDLVRKVADLNFLAVLGKDEKPAYKQQRPTLQYKVKLASGETLAYTISKPEKGDAYVLKASNSPYYFSVSKYTVDGLTGIKRADLAQTKGDDAKTDKPADAAEESATARQSKAAPAASPPGNPAGPETSAPATAAPKATD